MSVTSKNNPFSIVDDSRMTITTGRLLIIDDADFNGGIVFMGRGSSLKWSEVNISWDRFPGALMILPLLHHCVVLIEASICIFNNECVLELY